MEGRGGGERMGFKHKSQKTPGKFPRTKKENINKNFPIKKYNLTFGPAKLHITFPDIISNFISLSLKQKKTVNKFTRKFP